MKQLASVAVLLAALGLAACGPQSPAENTAEALENAAEHSTPEAAAVLENAAEEIRESNSTAPISEPGSPGQKALEQAGAAQAPSKAPASPPVGAKPHAKGDPVPPPKIQPGTEEAQHNGH